LRARKAIENLVARSSNNDPLLALINSLIKKSLPQWNRVPASASHLLLPPSLPPAAAVAAPPPSLARPVARTAPLPVPVMARVAPVPTVATVVAASPCVEDF